MELKKIIANNIFMLRNKYKLTQEEFAQKLNITRGHLSHIENGENMPSAEFIKDVCCSFDVSADWVMNLSINTKEGLYFTDKELLAIVSLNNLDNETEDIILNLIEGLIKNKFKKMIINYHASKFDRAIIIFFICSCYLNYGFYIF